MWLHPVGVNEDVQTYISPKLCLTPDIKSKYFRTGECVGIGQTTVFKISRVEHEHEKSFITLGPDVLGTEYGLTYTYHAAQRSTAIIFFHVNGKP